MRKTFGGLKKKHYLCSRFLKEITARGVFRKDIELLESCLSGRKSRTRNAVYALRRTGGSNPSLSAKRRVRETEQNAKRNGGH